MGNGVAWRYYSAALEHSHAVDLRGRFGREEYVRAPWAPLCAEQCGRSKTRPGDVRAAQRTPCPVIRGHVEHSCESHSHLCTHLTSSPETRSDSVQPAVETPPLRGSTPSFTLSESVVERPQQATRQFQFADRVGESL